MNDYDKPIAVIFGGLGLIFILMMALIYFDARAFADECVRAGGYVASAGTCVK